MDTINEIEMLEKKFLSYLFHDKKYIAAVFGKITKEHMKYHPKIYTLLLSYYSKYKAVITDDMAELMFQRKNLDSATIVDYKILISQLRAEKFFDDGEFNAILEQLLENRKRQEFVQIAEKIVNINPIECNSSEFKKLEDSIKSSIIKATANTNDVKDEGSIKDSVRDRLERYKQVKANPDILKYIPTGFKHIDDDNGGFTPGESIVITGRKGDGKSVFLLNLAHNMWKAGFNVIIFSLEIKKADYERRFDARAAGINSNGLKMGRLTDEEEKLYEDYLTKQEQGLSIDNEKTGIVYIVDTPPGITTAFVDSKIETLEQLLGIKFDVVITDYMGIMQPAVSQAEKRLQQGQIALEHKIIARQRDCVVITAAQKSRAGAKEKGADSSFIAESDAVADHIDWGIDIMSVSEENGIIQTFKTRDAAPVKFSFKKQYNMFKIVELDQNLDCWDQLT